MGYSNDVRAPRWISDRSAEYRNFIAPKIAQKKAEKALIAAQAGLPVLEARRESLVNMSAVTEPVSNGRDGSCPLEVPAFKPRPVGPLVERAVCFWLRTQVKLQQDTVLAWLQRQHDGEYATRYQQVDAVWMADYDCAVLFEIKFATLDRMESLFGSQQLKRAAWPAKHKYRQVRKRLVYVGDAFDRLITGLHGVEADDCTTEEGVIWVTPTQVERAAQSLGLDLPFLWWDLEDRFPSEGTRLPEPTATLAR